MNRIFLTALISATLMRGLMARDQGVINDPDGFTNLRSGSDASSPVVAKVKSGEVFDFESAEGSDWWKVTLASGKSGWMHKSRIRLHYTFDDLPEKDEEGSEIAYYGKEHGFDYCATARAAAQGEPAAMKRYFRITDTDGAAAESHAAYFCQVIHLLGDEKLAAFLKDQPLEYRVGVRNELFNGVVLWPFEELTYAERNFPKTTAVLCRKEVTDWPSPDGVYLIRKAFSDARPRNDSRVVRAEVLEKASGRVLAEFTSDDLGAGLNREGRILWSPDSRRFASMSGALGAGGEAKTVVYVSTGGGFERVKQPAVVFPGRGDDAELKGATKLWQFVEPERWNGGDVLVLTHHEYFETTRPDRSIHSIGRTYELTWDVAAARISARLKAPGE